MATSQHVIIPTHHSVGRASVHLAPGSRRGIALFASSGGGAREPSGVFEELALYFQSAGITAFRFRLRAPDLFVPTVLDLRSVVDAMSERGVDHVVLVVEAKTRRAATAAPIAYRSVVGLVDKVVGVATILPQVTQPLEKLPRTLPADLLFLLRSARAHPDGVVAQREIVRSDRRTELYLAPGRLRGREDGVRTIVAPVFSWAQRTLHYPRLQDNIAQDRYLNPDGITDAEPASLSLDGAALGAVHGIPRIPLTGRRLGAMSTSFREVWEWLVDELRRICADQVARDPLHALPQDLTMPAQMDRLSAQSLLRWFSGQHNQLDRLAQVEWIAAYVRASQMVAEMTATGAPVQFSTDSACGA